MKKRFLATVLTGMMALSLTACQGAGSETTAVSARAESTKAEGGNPAEGGAKNIKIAYAFANIDENNQRTLNAIREYIEELNAAGEYNVEFIYTDSQSQVDKQITDVESLIQQKPDLINVSAVDVIGSVPCLQAVADAGIICVDDRGCDAADIYNYHFTSFNEDVIAELKVQAMKDYLDANPDKTLNIGCIYGLASQSEQLKRIQCILDLDEDPEYGDRINILATQYCDWSTDKAAACTEDWLIKYPEMNAICTASDDMGLGACNSLNAAGKSDFYVDGVDGTSIGVQLCEDGTQYYVTIGANQAKIQRTFIDVAIQAIEGTFTDKEYTCDSSCFMIVTRDNYTEYSSN